MEAINFQQHGPYETLPHQTERARRVLSVGQALLRQHPRTHQLPQTQQRRTLFPTQSHALRPAGAAHSWIISR